MRAAGLLTLGLGIGLGAGYLATDRWGSPALVWCGLALVVLSTVLLASGPRRRPRSAAPVTDPPLLSGLGVRTEQILRLAEEQAADHLRAAREEAGRIVAEARTRSGQPPD